MRRIVRAKVKFLSLVPKGANQMPVIYKAEDNTIRIDSLVKATDSFDEQGELLSVVYAPELRDSQGDIASSEVIKQMMYDAAKEGMALDMRHDEKELPKDAAFVAESFIIQKGDERFKEFTNYKGDKVDVTGGWATVIKIEDADLRKAYREGKWNGVSIGGSAEFATEKSDLEGFVEKLANLIKDSNSKDGDLDMDKSELNKILDERDERLTKSIVEDVVKALKPEDNKDKKQQPTAKADDTTGDEGDDCPVKKPVLKDATDPKVVAEYQKQLKAYNLAKEVDWTDEEQVAEYQKQISAKPEDVQAENEAAGVKKEDTDEVADLKRRLAKAQSKSNASGGDSNDRPGGEAAHVIGGLSKEDTELFEAGRKAGQAHAKQHGIK